MRLIDADDLITKYGDWYTEEGPEEGFIGTIKDLVDQMPTITPELCWIPCKERCPDENNWFLVTLADGRCTPRFYYGDGWDEDHKGRDVIAWLPNPEPYKRNHRENRKA